MTLIVRNNITPMVCSWGGMIACILMGGPGGIRIVSLFLFDIWKYWH